MVLENLQLVRLQTDERGGDSGSTDTSGPSR